MKTLSACIVSSALLVVSGCAVERASIASRAQTEMIGMTKPDLLGCAGVPARETVSEGLDFLTYTGGGDRIGSAVANSSGSSAVVVGRSAQRYCEATFVLKDGRVQKVNYAGRTGGLLTSGEQCAFIVQNCIHQ